MENRRLYQETFSQVHSTVEIGWEAYETIGRRRRSKKRWVPLAAVLVLLGAVTTVAAATGWFGLRELLLPAGPEEETAPADVISLQGYGDSPEGKALAEWEAFLAKYDVDGEILESVGNGPTGLEGEPSAGYYGVYTPEMLEALRAIAGKYGLNLHTEMNMVDHDELCRRVGGEFLAENHQKFWAYLYEDGTFQTDGGAVLPGLGAVDYQLRRSVKGTFDEVTLHIGAVGEYREQAYETAGGGTVTLALGPGKALILGDFSACLVAVNVLSGTSSGLSMEDLESLADGIRFDVLQAVTPPEMTGDSQAQAGLTAELFYAATAMEEPAAQAFYRRFRQAVEEDRRLDAAEMIVWPRLVTTADGEEWTVASAEDFLPLYGQMFTPGLLEEMSRNQYTEDRADLIPHDGMVGAAGGCVWFALTEDGQIAVTTVQSPDGGSIRYDGPAGVTAG